MALLTNLLQLRLSMAYFQIAVSKQPDSAEYFTLVALKGCCVLQVFLITVVFSDIDVQGPSCYGVPLVAISGFVAMPMLLSELWRGEKRIREKQLQTYSR